MEIKQIFATKKRSDNTVIISVEEVLIANSADNTAFHVSFGSFNVIIYVLNK